MNSKKSFITAFALFLISVSAFSQIIPQVKTDQTFTADYVSKNWTTEDGLPGMTITTVLQDNTGYMWIGTYDGLVRFDGVEFKTFSRSNDARFDFASARSLCQASDGKIWIGHNDEGVTSYVPNGEIKKYTMALGLPNNKVNSVCEDLQHNIWVGTASGLCYITPENEIKFPFIGILKLIEFKSDFRLKISSLYSLFSYTFIRICFAFFGFFDSN